MRALLVLTCGTVGGTFVTAAALTSILFVCTGHARNLALVAYTLACWSLVFGGVFLVVAFVGHCTGVTEPLNHPAKEGSVDV